MNQMPNSSPSTIKIIDEQDDFIVVYKPINISFHDEGELGEGFFNQVKKQTQATELYPVHRLDKMTSGLLIAAKNKTTAKLFQALFNTHQIEKYYLAISDKKPSKKQGLIKGDMQKSRRSAWKLMRTQKAPAVTQFFSTSIAAGKRLYIIKPHTGKTHQIRVALASIGAPIIGDPIYANSAEERGYLHAFSMQFTISNQTYCYQSIPTEGELFNTENCLQQIKQWCEPWKLDWPKI